MTESIILETTTRAPKRRINKESLDAFTEQAAFSYGYVMAVSWMIGTMIICVLIFSVRKWIFFYSGYHMANDTFMQFWLVWGILSSSVAYFMGKHIKRIQMINEYLRYMQSPTEITERQIQNGTRSMDYDSTGVNVSRTAVRNHGESIIELEERAENVGNMQFSSEMMAIIRRMAIHSNRVSRDRVWQPMKDAGLIEGSVVSHYRQSMKLFTHSSRKWVSGNKWTPNAYRSFLRVDSPHLSPEVMQNPDFDRDDDDDEAGGQN